MGKSTHCVVTEILDACASGRVVESTLFGDDIKKLFPIVEPDFSDSGTFDNVARVFTAVRQNPAGIRHDDDP